MLRAGDPLLGLTVELRTQLAGPVVAREDVTGRDLAEALAELSFEAGLRRKGQSLALSALKAQMRPFRRNRDDSSGQASRGRGGRHCSGFTLEADSPEGQPVLCQFERHVFDPVATRASRRLIEAGKLAEGDLYFYDIEVPECSVGPLDVEGSPILPEQRPIAPLLARAQAITGDPERGRADESYAREQLSGGDTPLRSVARQAERENPVDPHSGRDGALGYPVFYTRAALDRAERISRKGAGSNPPVESGGLLLGRIFWCDESRTLYCMIEDTLEARDSEETPYSLTFTAKTWGRVQAVLRARQRRPETRNQRILGQCHGHNFLPYSENETCDGCPAQGSCKLSTAYLSESDRRWCRAVFPREPWQLSHVFGLTPRREPVSAFYGQRGAVLEPRDYYVVDE
jgi:hypothetical protein